MGVYQVTTEDGAVYRVTTDDEGQAASAPKEGASEKKPTSFAEDIGDTLQQYWNRINPVTGAQALVSPQTYKSYGPQNEQLFNRAKESFHQGDYAAGVRHSLSYFLNGIPGVGALLDEAGNKAAQGDTKGAIADTAALATQLVGMKAGPKALEAATEPGAVSQAVGRVTAPVKATGNAIAETALVPGTGKLLEGTGELAAGAGLTAKGHIMAGPALMIRGYDRFIKGIAERRAAINAPAPILEDLSQSLAGKSYSSLTPDAQAQIRQISTQVREVQAGKRAPTSPPPGPIDLGPMPEKRTTIGDLMSKELESRRPPSVDVGGPKRMIPMSRAHNVEVSLPPIEAGHERIIPLSRGHNPKIEAPKQPSSPKAAESEAAPVSSAGAAEPKAESIKRQLAKELIGSEEGGTLGAEGIHPPPEAYERTFQGERARILAQHWKNAGISYEQSKEINPGSLTDKQWTDLLNQRPRGIPQKQWDAMMKRHEGITYRRPSEKTIHQARVFLGDLYKRSKKAPGKAKTSISEIAENGME